MSTPESTSTTPVLTHTHSQDPLDDQSENEEAGYELLDHTENDCGCHLPGINLGVEDDALCEELSNTHLDDASRTQEEEEAYLNAEPAFQLNADDFGYPGQSQDCGCDHHCCLPLEHVHGPGPHRGFGRGSRGRGGMRFHPFPHGHHHLEQACGPDEFPGPLFPPFPFGHHGHHDHHGPPGRGRGGHGHRGRRGSHQHGPRGPPAPPPPPPGHGHGHRGPPPPPEHRHGPKHHGPPGPPPSPGHGHKHQHGPHGPPPPPDHRHGPKHHGPPGPSPSPGHGHGHGHGHEHGHKPQHGHRGPPPLPGHGHGHHGPPPPPPGHGRGMPPPPPGPPGSPGHGPSCGCPPPAPPPYHGREDRGPPAFGFGCHGSHFSSHGPPPPRRSTASGGDCSCEPGHLAPHPFFDLGHGYEGDCCAAPSGIHGHSRGQGLEGMASRPPHRSGHGGLYGHRGYGRDPHAEWAWPRGAHGPSRHAHYSATERNHGLNPGFCSGHHTYFPDEIPA